MSTLGFFENDWSRLRETPLNIILLTEELNPSMILVFSPLICGTLYVIYCNWLIVILQYLLLLLSTEILQLIYKSKTSALLRLTPQ